MKTVRLFVLLFVSFPVLLSAQELSVPGLKDTVEILTDRWGVAHIYANNEHDLFFAQGYNAAKDRTFQFELWRRQATGTVAEILGRRELDRDIGTRLHMFRKDMTQELNHYHPRGEAIITAYVDGINAFIDATERNPDLLSLEFELLGIKPGKWTPAVVISRHQGLLSNVTRELRIGRAVAVIGPEKVRELDWFRPGEPVLALDPVIDGARLEDDILHYYEAFRRPIEFEPDDLVAAYRNDHASHERLAAAAEPFISNGDGTDAIGSNNWVVSGRFTQTGFPYVVNDPHRVLAAPSLRYFVHLTAPGWNVIGGGEPVLPGVSIGHNEFGAWGLTVFGQDNEDLYVYETNPANPNQYRYLDGWEEMRVIKDTIAIKGESPETVELKYTRHGPVLYEDKEHHKAYALRAAWMEIGSSPYLASLRINQAQTWEEFVEACSYSRIPAENMIWGDIYKNIGYQAVGISPIRPHWSGLVPVPGDGRYEWEGYLPITALPRVKNPDKGYWATANNYMLPDDYPYPSAIHYTWGDEMRGLRVNELMASGRRFTIVDMMQFQHDELSIPARSIVPLLMGIDIAPPDARERAALEKLDDWDFVVDKDSIAAAIYVSFERELMENVREIVVPEAARSTITRLNKKRVIDWLVAPDGRFGEHPIAGRDEVLAKSFSEAIASLTERLGSDMTAWQYGQEAFKHVLIHHALSPAVDAVTREKLDVGPAPRGGYDSTLNNTSRRDNQRSGASFRVIMDVANWDNSIATTAPGQAGDPDSPHYRDLFELFVKGQYFPLFYSREKIESVTESRTVLAPAGATDR
ncbi:MAG: penicillin acylase family protein [Acidobacteria bacterium]|nr:MAG: penicillin acylase family protein [Acidobacteriota bacterium]